MALAAVVVESNQSQQLGGKNGFRKPPVGKTRHVRPDSLDGAGRRNFDCGRDWARRVAIYLHPQLEPILGLDRQRNGGGLMFAATHSLVAEGVAIRPERLVAGI